MIVDICSSYEGEDYSVRYFGWSALDARIEFSFLLHLYYKNYLWEQLILPSAIFALRIWILDETNGLQQPIGDWTWRFGWNSLYPRFFSKSIFSGPFRIMVKWCYRIFFIITHELSFVFFFMGCYIKDFVFDFEQNFYASMLINDAGWTMICCSWTIIYRFSCIIFNFDLYIGYHFNV